MAGGDGSGSDDKSPILVLKIPRVTSASYNFPFLLFFKPPLYPLSLLKFVTYNKDTLTMHHLLILPFL